MTGRTDFTLPEQIKTGNVNFEKEYLLEGHFHVIFAFPWCVHITICHLALLTQVLGMLLTLVRYVKTVWFLERTLFVRVDVDVALDTLLVHVRPAIPTHPARPWTIQRMLRHVVSQSVSQAVSSRD